MILLADNFSPTLASLLSWTVNRFLRLLSSSLGTIFQENWFLLPVSSTGPETNMLWIRNKKVTGSLVSGHCHLPHSCSAKFAYVLLYFPFLFGKKLFSVQDKLVNNKQTHFLKQKKITPIYKRCVLLINLWTNPAVCW